MKKQDKPDVSIAQRKRDHLELVLRDEALHSRSTLFECVRPVHCALPELSLDEVNTDAELFGRTIKWPIMITGMTGGVDHAAQVNRLLARVAGRLGIPFGLGSQRIMLTHREVAPTFAVRGEIADGVLVGNIGGAELCSHDLREIVKLVQAVEADGIAVHLNPAQEIVQAEGARSFVGVLDGIARLVDMLDGRVIVKETGCGLSPQVVRRLVSVGVRCVDVSGSGGTSFTRVEMLRAEEARRRSLGRDIADWGVPTAAAIVGARKAGGADLTVIGSGGVTNGVHAATAIMLGADIVGVARAVLAAFSAAGEEGASAFLEEMFASLRAVMLLTGSRTLRELGQAPRVVVGELRGWLDQLETVA